MNVLLSVAVLGLLIIFHELGHFLAATLQGIKVSGFSIGFGPAIIKKEFKEVTYALRILPLGGFVSFPDDDKGSKINNKDKNLLQNRPIFQRVIVISAGVIANLFLAWIILTSQATLIGLPNQPDPGVLIMSVQPEEAAFISGLSSGDRILSVNNKNLGEGESAVRLLVKEIQESPDIKLKLETIYKGINKTLYITPSNNKGTGKIGAQLQVNVSGNLRPAKGPIEIISYANNQFVDLLSRTIQGYKGLITDFGSTSKQLSGPVKIIEIGAQLSEQGGTGIVLFAALVSINLAVLNSLPFPLLDGGQLMLLLIEAIRGQPIPQKIELAFMQSGFLLLVGLSVVLIIRDTTQLSLFQQLIGGQ